MPNGEVTPVGSPILRKGDTYEFIDNLLFDDTQLDYGLVIQRDNIVVNGEGFLIQNNLTYVGIGIILTGRNNITITNMTISFYRGLQAVNSSNIKIENIHITHWSRGMRFINSTNIEIINNNITSPRFIDPGFGTTGIKIQGDYPTYGEKSNYTISNNTITHEYLGIGASAADYSLISWNNISRCQTGLGVGSHSQVFANNLFDMVKNMGLKAGEVEHRGTAMVLGDENLIYANNFTGNGVGVKLNGDFGNVFYGNNFVDNQLYDVDLGTDMSQGNSWDNGTYGNYWSNYNGTDNNGDGIGDAPYIFDDNNQDNYPLINPLKFNMFPEKIDLSNILLIEIIGLLAILSVILLVIIKFRKKKEDE